MKKNIKLVLIMLIVSLLTFACVKALINKKETSLEVTKKEEVNYFILKENGKEGVIDKNGNKIVEPTYDKIIMPNYSYPLFFGYENGKQKILDDKAEFKFAKKNLFGKDVQEQEVYPIYEEIGEVSNVRQFLKYKNNEKYGLMDLNGKEITKAIYDEISPLPEDSSSYLIRVNGREGLINNKGEEILKPEYKMVYSTNINSYNEADKISEGYGYIKEDENHKEMHGYITKNGNILIGPKYEGINKMQLDSKDTFLIVEESNKKGVFKNQEKVIDVKYEDIIYNPKFVAAKSENKYTLFNLNGKRIDENIEEIKFIGNYVFAKKGEKYIAFNEDEKQIAEFNKMPEDIFRFENEDYVILTEETKKSINEIKEGKITNVIGENKVFENIRHLYDDVVLIPEEGKIYAVKLKDKKQTKEKYLGINIFLNTKMLIADKENGESILLNSNLDEIENIDETTIKQVKEKELEGIVAEVDGKNVYISKEGKIESLTEKIDRKLYPYKDHETNKFGYKNKEGKVVINPTFDKADLINMFGFAGVVKDGMVGVVSEEGKLVVEPKINVSNIQILNSEISPIYITKYIVPATGENVAYNLENMPNFEEK